MPDRTHISDPSPLRPVGAPAVVLASASEARARLLGAAGVAFEVGPVAVDEEAVKEAARAAGRTAAEAAVALAELKAIRASGRAAPGTLVIGADQILTVEGRWLDKARDRAEALEQLRVLRGRRHTLIAAAVVMADGERVWHHVAEARLGMRPFSDDFLVRYLDAAGDDALASVGGYRLEDLGAQLFAAVEGDHFVIQGLPLLPLLDFLRARGVLLP